MLKTQNLLRTTNPENFGSIWQTLLKISFLKGKNNSLFWKTSFELIHRNRNSKNKFQYLKIHILIKTKIRQLAKFRHTLKDNLIVTVFSHQITGVSERQLWRISRITEN